MYCPKCGWQNEDNAAKCANCFNDLRAQSSQAPQPPPQQTQQMPPGQPPYSQPPQYGQPQYYQPQYGQQPYTNNPAAAIPDYLPWSIVVTVLSVLCCCFLWLGIPFGIIAIVKSAQCAGKKTAGNYYGALSDSNAAKMWLLITVGAWAASILLGLISGFMGEISKSVRQGFDEGLREGSRRGRM